jgi:hypothetical protein
MVRRRRADRLTANSLVVEGREPAAMGGAGIEAFGFTVKASSRIHMPVG